MHENPRRSAVSQIPKPPCLAPTIFLQSKSLKSPSDIWSEKQLSLLTMSACFYEYLIKCTVSVYLIYNMYYKTECTVIDKVRNPYLE